MSNIFNRLLNKAQLERYILLGLSVIGVVLAFFYWQINILPTYDAAGHVALVEKIADSFWPKFAGWNANQLLGWPQGIFYPSLFHWLAAGLSFLVGASTAIKLLISLALIGLPSSIFIFSSSLTENRFWRLTTTLAIFLLILVYPNFLGVGLRALFQIGLLSNFFVLPILFLFLASMHGRWNASISALLLSLVVLTHLVAAMVAGVYLAIFAFSKLFFGAKFKEIPYYFKIVGIAALLTAFFWVPFVVNIEFTSVSRHVSSYFGLNLAVSISSVALVLYSLKNKNSNIFILSLFSAIFSILAASDGYLIGRFGTSFSIYQFHLYRFQPFAYMFFVAAAILTVSKLTLFEFLERNKIRQGILLILGFGIVMLAFIARNPAKLPDAKFEVSNQQATSGRFIETFRRKDADPFWYGFQTELAKKDNAQWAYGLFTDSTPNGPYLGSLIRSLWPEAYPEGEDIFIENKFIDERNVQKALDLFGIQYLLNLNEERRGKKVGKWSVGGNDKVYALEMIGESRLAEVTDLNLVPVGRNFDEKVKEWWDQDNEWSTLPFESHLRQGFGGQAEIEKLNNDKFDPKAKVEVLSHNIDWTIIKLNIVSEAPQPVLIKFSYFPWWKAISGSENVPIYRAAPNLMLIFAKGEVDLEFKQPIWLNLLYLISVATFLMAIFSIFKKKL